ncbi:MAG: MtrB/PioB family outer membrane beta-barrel protein, partial [Pseudomonadota bacterium]
MKRKLVLSGSALLSLLCVAGVQAEDGVSGHIEVTGKSIDVSGNRAKFSEYSDSDSGVTGGVELQYDAEAGFLNFTADEIARDTQSFNVEAGQYGRFELDAFYKEIQHNFNFDAKSFYNGVGSNRLTTTATSTALPSNHTTWPSVFDYAVSRDQYGAGIKLNMMKPFFADFSVSQEDRTGIKATGTYSGVSIELPEPVDYETNTFKAEIGYGQDPFFVSMSYLNSSFDNANEYLYFDSLTASNRSEFLSLAPDNDYSKFALKGRVKLPLSSSLSLSYGKSEAESEANLATLYNTAGNARTNVLSDSLFNGKVETTSYNIVLASSPLNFLDGKVFYSNYDKENKSDRIISTVGTTTFTNHLFDYEKTSYGVEAGLKLPADIKLTPYYKFVNVERH